MQFETALESGQPYLQESQKKTEQNIEKVIGLLIKEDKKKLFETIKKLNARQEYASMA